MRCRRHDDAITPRHGMHADDAYAAAADIFTISFDDAGHAIRRAGFRHFSMSRAA